jgi:hypothetical protein
MTNRKPLEALQMHMLITGLSNCGLVTCKQKNYNVVEYVKLYLILSRVITGFRDVC